jgi:uncharacterized protein YndB with AHSA1/START domain
MSSTGAESSDRLVIERTWPVPPDVVWKLWTEPEHLAAWYGPQGSTISEVAIDLRVGGARSLCMEVATPQGPRRMWFVGAYLEIVEGERLVYTDAMADHNGIVMTAEQLGMPTGHPTSTEVRVELEAVDHGTRMTLTHIGIPDGSPGAMGWTMALDKLGAHIDASRHR